MARKPKIVMLSVDSELAILLRDATRTGAPVFVDTGDAIYSLSVGVLTEKTAVPTAEEIVRSEEGIRNAAGRWKDVVDGESFKAYIAERRRSSSWPPVRG